MTQVQYISDENGQKTGVIAPIDLWRELQSEKETAYLLKGETMRNRLLEARQRTEDIDFEESCEKLGL